MDTIEPFDRFMAFGQMKRSKPRKVKKAKPLTPEELASSVPPPAFTKQPKVQKKRKAQ